MGLLYTTYIDQQLAAYHSRTGISRASKSSIRRSTSSSSISSISSSGSNTSLNNLIDSLDPRNEPTVSSRSISVAHPYSTTNRLKKRKKNQFEIYGCKCCRTHFASSYHIISKEYRGKTGNAFLTHNVMNVIEDKIEKRSMLTGNYIVCDILCNLCKTLVGWRYLHSDRNDQAHKEGKYILEVTTLCKTT